MVMVVNEQKRAYKPTSGVSLNTIARTFFISKIERALPHLRDITEYETIQRNSFCSAFFAQRFTDREIKYVLSVLEKNGVIELNGNSSIRILKADVLQNPEKLIRFFNNERADNDL